MPGIIRVDRQLLRSVGRSLPSEDVTPLLAPAGAGCHDDLLSRSSLVTELQTRVTAVTQAADTKLGLRGDLTDLA